MRSLSAWVAVTLLATCGPIRAGAAVTFVDGRSIVVDRLEWRSEQALLHLEGGGALAVPAERIASAVDLPEPVPEPEPKPPAAPQPRQGPWRRAAGDFAQLIADSAERHELDPALLTAMARVESAFDPRAVSPKGAGGLLQLMPDTADRFGVDNVFDAAQNVDGGARYLSWLLDRYEGRTDLALAGYNAGEGAVDRYSGIPPYKETRRYVRAVLAGVAELAP